MNIRIVMIDGHRFFCHQVVSYFQTDRPELIIEAVAHDGVSGLDAIASIHPDCVVMDLLLAGIDGISLLERIVNLNLEPRPRILVLTAFESETANLHLSQLGIDYLMLKPCNLSSLADRIEQMGLTLMRNAPSKVRYCIDPEIHVAEALGYIGIPTHTLGYRFLCSAVIAVMHETRLLRQITKELYPTVAKLNNTTSGRVERSMRHAIDLAWKRGASERTASYFGHDILNNGAKPSNSEFIALIAEKVRLEMFDRA